MKDTIIKIATVFFLLLSVVLILLLVKKDKKKTEVLKENSYICEYKETDENATTVFQLQLQMDERFVVSKVNALQKFVYPDEKTYQTSKESYQKSSLEKFDIVYQDEEKTIVVKQKEPFYTKKDGEASIWYKDYIKNQIDKKYQCQKEDNA